MVEGLGGESSSDLSADLSVLETVRWARHQFERDLCDASLKRSEEVFEILRLDTAYQFAEFFFLMKARRIETADHLAGLEEAHNLYLGQLMRDPAKMKRMNLRRSRIEDALFTGETRPRLLQDWRDGPGTIDQSNLARFLAMTMSTETCRKLSVTFAEAGFLVRRRSPYGTTLVRSTGVAEQVFGDCLRKLRLRLVQ